MEPSTTLLIGVAALAVVLGLVILLGRLARRTGLAPRGPRRLAMAEALSIDTRRRVIIVRCDGRECLILTGPAGDTLLGWLP